MMGWLQGARYRNLYLLKQDWNATSSKSTSPHVETVLPSRTRRDVNVTTKDNGELIKQKETETPLNEIEKLLEATFGPRNRESGQTVAQRDTQTQSDQGRTTISCSHRGFLDEDLDNQELRFIPREEVMSKTLAIGKNDLISEENFECLWIVVDNIVYDCGEFIRDHPGGKQVILSFVGEDCSWQFWRFHSRSDMDQYGRPLRIGRTAGVLNRFEERPKYVGLHRSNHDEC